MTPCWLGSPRPRPPGTDWQLDAFHVGVSFRARLPAQRDGARVHAGTPANPAHLDQTLTILTGAGLSLTLALQRSLAVGRFTVGRFTVCRFTVCRFTVGRFTVGRFTVGRALEEPADRPPQTGPRRRAPADGPPQTGPRRPAVPPRSLAVPPRSLAEWADRPVRRSPACC